MPLRKTPAVADFICTNESCKFKWDQLEPPAGDCPSCGSRYSHWINYDEWSLEKKNS